MKKHLADLGKQYHWKKYLRIRIKKYSSRKGRDEVAHKFLRKGLREDKIQGECKKVNEDLITIRIEALIVNLLIMQVADDPEQIQEVPDKHKVIQQERIQDASQTLVIWTRCMLKK